MLRIAIASDHAGYNLKETLAAHLRERGDVEVDDLGPKSTERVDYPDYAIAVAVAVASGEARFGVLCCGTGIGVAMAANKVAGIRAATAHNGFTARAAREHNDANVICLGERVVGSGVAIDALDAFLAATFQEGRHTARVAKINALD